MKRCVFWEAGSVSLSVPLKVPLRQLKEEPGTYHRWKR
jgi:hypothetical protein